MILSKKNNEESSYAILQGVLASKMSGVDDIIHNLAKSHVEMIPKVTEHLTGSGGKRIRPLITLASAAMLDYRGDGDISLAAAVEFIHTATLLHDDVIDESVLRRGKSTANTIWGNKPAILVGDFLLSHAFKLMVKSGSMEALDLLADAAVKITESEVWQLELLGKLEYGLENYMSLISGKTASLFAASASVAGHLMHDKGAALCLYEYGKNLGIIFQISDDVLDYEAKEEDFGKKICGDFLEQKCTLPLMLLMERATSEERKEIARNFIASQVDTIFLKQMMQKYNIKSAASQYMEQYVQSAQQALSGFRGEHQVLLHNLVRHVADRIFRTNE